ncbi:hypothetical protein QLX67_03260 [Balneolaceae bacterium ANBcel3]|nr:hypothetical protein [Balneolaceae bacterium ANBcel3]
MPYLLPALALILILALLIYWFWKPSGQSSSDSEPYSILEIFDLESERRTIVHEKAVRFEAPNWTPDGSALIYNQEGLLYRIPVDGGKPAVVSTGFADRNNNDHGISPDGKWIAISHHDAEKPEGSNSTIYIVPIDGGEPQKVTEETPSYWHGWHPDGKSLVYTAERNGQYDIYTSPVEGGRETQLTNTPGLDDGPEYAPDGETIYFNSIRSGLMHIWQMDADGSNPVQLTNDTYNNWFPHPSPDGKQLVFITYIDPIDPATHPPDKKVMLRLMDLETGTIKELARFTGGQGTINVPSWSPCGKKFAFVSYIQPA